jgi:VanZ family protein
MKNLKEIFYLWLPVILWSGIIFFWSSIPYLKIPILGFWNFVFRKSAHTTEFAILAFLYFRAFNKNGLPKKFFWPVFCSITFAVSDEIHEHFVPGRFCNIRDVLIDTVGIILGSGGYIYLKLKKS